MITDNDVVTVDIKSTDKEEPRFGVVTRGGWDDKGVTRV